MHYIVFKVRIVFVYNNCHKLFNWLLWNVSPYASTFFFAEDSQSKNTIRFIPVLIYDYANFCWKDCRYISIFALPLKGESKFFRNFYASREIWLDLNHCTQRDRNKKKWLYHRKVGMLIEKVKKFGVDWYIPYEMAADSAKPPQP